jgi:hypothetical protein
MITSGSMLAKGEDCLTETKNRGPGRPKGATALDPDSEIDRLIMKRAEAQEQAREAANNKARHALRQQHERAQRRQGASRTTVAATLGLPLSGVDELMAIAEEGERGGS